MKKYIANYNNKKFSTDLIVENIDNLILDYLSLCIKQIRIFKNYIFFI